MSSAEGGGRVRRAPAPVTAAAASVLFKHPSGTRAKRVKPGFAWDLFLFAGVFGVPLFLRGLPNWGAAVLGLWLVDLGLGRFGRGPLQHPAELVLFAAFLGLQLWLGFKGNGLTARACRARGWAPDNPRDPQVRRALEDWGIGTGA
jgi:hypothetical protein